MRTASDHTSQGFTFARWQKWLLAVCGAVAVVVAGALIALSLLTYGPSAAASEAVTSAEQTSYGLYFDAGKTDQTTATPTVILYPGALVKPESYSVWAAKVADEGYPVAIVRFPLNLAVLNANAADAVALDGGDYVIGGHSLGGVMASRYAAAHPSRRLWGVFFLASYPDQKGSLAASDLPVLSLTGSRDGVLDWDAWNTGKRYVPAVTRFAQLDGGNHAGFGSYGDQRGDNSAQVSNGEQQTWIADELVEWLRE